jgi:O-succinylbenzoic acid--CoA ligase
MSSPFNRLTIDGRTLEQEAVLPWADALVQQHAQAPWTNEVRDTLRELCTGDGSITAHTSGTTGPPKAMRLHVNDLRASARLTGHSFHLRQGDRALLCLPCNFIAGKLMLVRGFVIGLDLHLIDPAGGVLNNLDMQDRFHFAAMVPNQLHRALQDDRARLERQFRTILLGGGPVSKALEEDLQDLNVEVFHGYGSTETLTHVALRRLNGPRKQEWSHAIGDITFEQDERGCLLVNTPHLRTKDHDTNDQVELLDERRFRWLGRYDHVILSGGRKIFPEQLEARTAGLLPYAHYYTARPDDKLGECVGLVLETDQDAATVVPEVLELLSTVLEPYEMPRRVTALDVFPRTPSGKVVR